MTSSVLTTSRSCPVRGIRAGGDDESSSSPPARLRSPGNPWWRRGRITIYIACSAFVWLVIWLTVWTIVPMAFGFEPRVVRTGSMSSAIDRGDVVLVQRSVADGLLAPGTIITFDQPAFRDVIVTHRIVEVDATGAIWTKGDANATRDSMPVPPDHIHGMARFLVPAIGLPSVWLAEGRIALVIAVTALAGLCGAVAFGMRDPLTAVSTT